MVKLCIFDMDGLLLDSERHVYLEMGLEASKAVGRPLTEEFLTSIMGAGWDQYEGNIKRAFGVDYPYEEYMKIFWPKVEYLIHETAIPLRPGVMEILEYCKGAGIKMAVATSSAEDVTADCLRNDKIDHYFDFCMTGDKVKHSKPDPEIFEKTVEHFGIDKSEILIFEDGHNGSQAALKCGCRLVIVKDLAYLSEEDINKAVLCTDNIAKAIDYIRKDNEGTTGI